MGARTSTAPRTSAAALTITLTAPLGDIVDRAGRPLATSDQAFSVVGLHAAWWTNPASAAQQLAPLLGRSETALTQLPVRPQAHLRAASRGVSTTTVAPAKLRRHDPTHGALDFKPEEHRIYPGDPVGRPAPRHHRPDGNGIAGDRAALPPTTCAAATLGQEVVVTAGDGGPVMRVAEEHPGAQGARRPAHARPRDPGPGRARDRADPGQVEGPMGHRGRARPEDRRDPGAWPRHPACRPAATARRRSTSSGSARWPTSTSPARRSRS